MKNLKYLLLGGLLMAGVTVLAAPSQTFSPSILPINTSTYDLGSALKTWANLYVDRICLSTDCKTAWPTGGGGGSGGGTFSTSTSQVSGQLTNHPINNTDIVTIGSSSTTSAPWYFDPNLIDAFLTSFRATNSTTTNATSTSFYNSGNASTTRLFANSAKIGDILSVLSNSTIATTTQFYGAGLQGTCNGTANKVTYTTGGKFLCEADQTGGGGGTPAGADTQVQYNNAGAFGADSSFYFDIGNAELHATIYAGNGSHLTNIGVGNATQIQYTDGTNLASSPLFTFSTAGAAGRLFLGSDALGSGAVLAPDNLTVGRGFFFPDKDGTFALTDDIRTATSSNETATYVPFWTTTNGMPAALSGGDSGFAWNNTTKELTATNVLFSRATGTSATATDLYVSHIASTTALTGVNISGFGLSTCTSTNALTWNASRFGCQAQPQGTVTTLTAGNGITFGGGTITSTGTISQDFTFSGTYSGANIFDNITRSTTTQATTTTAFMTSASTSNLFVGTGFGCLEATAAGKVITSTRAACGSGGGGALPNSKWATSTVANAIYNNGGGNVGVSTTTPQFKLQVTTAGLPQLDLQDTTGGTDRQHGLISYGDGVFRIGTSSDTTFTSTSTSVTITPSVPSQLLVGTSTGAATAIFSKGASATTTVSVGELGLSSSKACVNMQTSAGTQASFYINAGGSLVVELNQCR